LHSLHSARTNLTINMQRYTMQDGAVAARPGDQAMTPRRRCDRTFCYSGSAATGACSRLETPFPGWPSGIWSAPFKRGNCFCRRRPTTTRLCTRQAGRRRHRRVHHRRRRRCRTRRTRRRCNLRPT
jgi:hypothetical protein